jgi:hypothetical protein
MREGRSCGVVKQVQTGLVSSGGGGSLCTPQILPSQISYSLAYEHGTDSVPKRPLINAIRRRTTQKITRDVIINTFSLVVYYYGCNICKFLRMVTPSY